MSDPLLDALLLQREAAELGFDWQHLDELWGKLAEEVAELRVAAQQGRAQATDELGDLLFMAINIARHLEVDPVAALDGTCRKFQRRFAHVTRDLEKLSPMGDPRRIVEMEALWQDAKRFEKSDTPAT